MITRRVFLTGRVQGVGFRDWMVEEAERLGVSGWVRNRRDGSLEALLEGEAPAVAELLRACWRGPPYAKVAAVIEEPAAPCGERGFGRLPTA
jgi:acylphosphatase